MMDEVQASQGDILIVDDNPGNLTVLASMLTSAGYQVRSAINGETALRAIEAAPPDLVLLDVNMPGMNGHEVCKAIKQNPITADIPVICVSALSEFSDKLTAFECGASDYVTKPFQYPEVLARVRTHITLHHQRQEIAALQQLAERRDLELAIEREKLRFIQQYCQMTAFDLRGPLQNIEGWANILLQDYVDYGPSEVAPHFIDNANRSLKLLGTFYFLAFQFHSDLKTGKHQIDLNTLVQKLVPELHWQHERGEQVHYDVDETGKIVVIESLNGLLNSALAVVLDSVLRNTTDDSAITFHVYDDADMAVLEVEVSHVSEDDLSRVFTNQSAPTLVQNIVKLHDGRIEIEQTPDGGGLFRMLLPLLSA